MSRASPRIAWPDGARVALSLVLNLEEWSSERPSPFEFPLPPGTRTERDTVTVTDREYGYRAGVWRIFDLCAAFGVPLTSAVSGLAAERHPDVMDALRQRGDEAAGHGYDQSIQPLTLDRAAEEDTVRRTVAALERAVGTRPVGWLSPAARATDATVELLAAHGFLWHSDTLADDVPRVVRVGGRPIVEIPYNLLTNDYRFYVYGNPPLPPEAACAWLREEFEALWEEGADRPALMTVGLHPHVTGRPARARGLRGFLAHVRTRGGVWRARRAEIARWWLDAVEGLG